MTEREAAIAVCQRLAETQQNMDVPITNLERHILRLAATLLQDKGTMSDYADMESQRIKDLATLQEACDAHQSRHPYVVVVEGLSIRCETPYDVIRLMHAIEKDQRA